MSSIIQDAQRIVRDSIDAVLPDAAVRRALAGQQFAKPVKLIAIGKAAWRMAYAACTTLGDQVDCGVIITKYNHSEGEIPRMEIFEAGHPVPDENGVRGTKRALELVHGLTPEDTVLLLVSGGGSALFELPLEGATLDDIAFLTHQLLACGADITEINTLRKHLSAVKGGRFGAACAPAHVQCIVLSDVLGDSLDTIASGPAVPDQTSREDVQRLIAKYSLTVPEHLYPLLNLETPKQLSHITTHITGNVTALCQAAADSAQALGYHPLLVTTTLNCEAREAGAMLASIAREIRRSGQPVQPPCAVILGGETVVHLHGNGKGGRNQELALASAVGIDGLPDTCIFSVGSDGTDGPTDAAGGIVTGEFARKAKERGLSIEAALADNDSYAILRDMDAHLMTGPTGTNVNDVCMLLCR
ncbi:MAG: glycerate kinase [Clostridia bacterium]|nr:glycerate kinase [Clostridia bacterium]